MLALALGVFALVFLLVRNKPKHKTADLKGWTWMFSKGMSKPQVDGDTLTFRIRPGDQAQYLFDFDAKQPYTRVKVKTTGEVRSAKGGEPTVALCFMRKGDDWQSDDYRWFSRARCGPNGEIAISADPADWKNVRSSTGADKPEAFRKAWDNMEATGVCFGGNGPQAGAGKGWIASGAEVEFRHNRRNRPETMLPELMTSFAR